MNNYQKNKARVRDIAIEWQYTFPQEDHYMSECVYWDDYFTKMGKRYGLLKEFRINCII